MQSLKALKLPRVKLPAFISRKSDAEKSDSSTFAATVAEDPTAHDSGGGDDIVLNDAPPPDDRPFEELPTIGHIGRYALKYRLGEGGLGTVYAALDPLLTRAIAVKTLHVEVEPEHRAALEASFLHEARAAAGLNHPHIVTVYDAGASEHGLYIAMERLKGSDLRQLLQGGWRPTPQQAATIVRRVADALAYAHDKGVVHCDIKPANIFMVSRTSPKVLDFGIAHVAKRPGGPTQAPFAAGSPCYMAPEQLRGEPVDRRSDVYALGAVLYELLTFKRAFSGATLEEIVDAALNQDPTPVQDLNPEAPATLAAIAQRALAKDPAQRFRSARQLAQALRLWMAEQPATPAVPQLERSAPRRWDRLALGVAALGGIGLVAALLWPSSPGPTAMQEPAPAASAPQVAAAPAPAPVAEPASAAEPSASAASAVAEAASTPTAEPAPVASSSPLAALVATTAASKPTAARERKVKPKAEPAPATAPIAPAATGALQLAVSPWGQVEVDGNPVGTTPPMNRLVLPEGTHTITIRNSDFPPFTTTVKITADQPTSLKHRFGS